MRLRTKLGYALTASLILGGTTTALVRRAAAQRPFEGPGVIPVEAYVENDTNGQIPYTTDPVVQVEMKGWDTSTSDNAGADTEAWIQDIPGMEPSRRFRVEATKITLDPVGGDRKASKIRPDGYGKHFTTKGVKYHLTKDYVGKYLVVGASNLRGRAKTRSYLIK